MDSPEYFPRAAVRLSLAWLILLSAASVSSAETEYPADALTNQILKVHFYLPEPSRGYYRGTRFDWSGLISRVDYQGHSFFSEFKEEHDPLNHDDICGTAEEFGISSPAGFGEAKAGQPFLKIGIGLLEKPDDAPYTFTKRYRIVQVGDWHVQKSQNQAEFRQVLKSETGWSYTYVKTIQLSPTQPKLTIRRVLTNTGSRTIQTDHYVHNFLRIDDAPAGPDYVVDFPFEVRLGNDSRPQGFVEARGHSLAFLKPIPKQTSVWLRLEGFSPTTENRMTLRNQRTGAAMEILTDQPATRLAFYAGLGVLSPEPFVEVKLPPGAIKEWKTTYIFQARKN